MTNKLSLDFGENKKPPFRRKIMQNVVVDRGSKYTVVAGLIESKEEAKSYIKDLLTDKYFRKATHNTYAYRVKLENGSILEGKNDDGETGAGNCILRELQREEVINTIIVVTRYFGGIKLGTDRFKNVIDVSKIALQDFI